MNQEVSAWTFHVSKINIGIENFVNQLLQNSYNTVLLRPHKNSLHIHSVEDIQHSLKRWPNWSSRPWIIAGNSEIHRASPAYDGPFAKDCRGDKFQQQIAQLMENFDWVLFSYFTTYQDDIWIFVTTNPAAPICQLLRKQQQAIITHSCGPSPWKAFRNATYYDRGEEGWLPYELAQERCEDFPFVVSEIYENEKLMALQSEALGNIELETTNWYEEPFSRLELVMEICVSRVSWARQRYFIHRAADLDAYLKLWSQSSSGREVADAVFSADCNLDLLAQRLRNLNSVDTLDIIRDTQSIATWGYGLIYGGGSDEYHAIFHSRDATITDSLWEHVSRTAISRF